MKGDEQKAELVADPNSGSIATPYPAFFLDFDDALAEFAAGVGHEFNNPLAIIGGHAQVLLGHEENPEDRRRLAIILAQVQRAYEMIADIRLFARPPEPVLRKFDLGELLESLVYRFSDESNSLHVPNNRGDSDGGKKTSGSPTILLEKSPESAAEMEIVSDPEMIAAIVGALVKNAREAIDDSSAGIIRISYRLVDDDESGKRRGEIAVEDNGPGLSEEAAPRLFYPYYSGRSSGRGLGFGLPKSRAMAHRLGGELRWEPVAERRWRVESEEGQEGEEGKNARKARFLFIFPDAKWSEAEKEAGPDVTRPIF